jgi:hypothetical protein
MDVIIAKHLRALFGAKAGQYPFLPGTAEIKLKTVNDGEMSLVAKTPAEAASFLQHIYNHDGQGIFDRTDPQWNVQRPLHFRMYKNILSDTNQKEHGLLAFNMNFRDLDEPSNLWLSEPVMSDEAAHESENTGEKPAMIFEGPTFDELIAVLSKAGQTWQDVNFMRDHQSGRPHLQIVQPV